MNIEELKNSCLSLKDTEESMPFDDKTLVFSVKGEMFCTAGINTYESVNLKRNPDKATRLRGQYDEITEGYYMNKKYWNSVKTRGKTTDRQFQEWIKDSYDLIVSALPKKI